MVHAAKLLLGDSMESVLWTLVFYISAFFNRLRPIPVLGIGIGPIPAISSGIGYRRYCSRYRPIPIGRRCNNKMLKYRVDCLISLPAAMAANGVDSSMHNQPRAIMLFTAFYNDLPRRTCDNHRLQGAHWVPTSKVPRNSPHYREPDAIGPARRDSD